MMNLPKNIIGMSVTFSRFGVVFCVEKVKNGPEIVYTMNHSMYDKNGDEACGVSKFNHDVIDVTGDPAYVFADINTVLRIEGSTVTRAQDLPPAIHKKRELLLEKFHEFYTKWRVSIDDSIVKASSDKAEINIDFAEEPTAIEKYFKPDGSFKSNGAYVRFFCAYIEGDM